MAIRFQHTLDVASEPQEAFAVLDDLAGIPRWLERCTEMKKVKPGANAVGDKLKYSYKDGGRSGVMDGEITARTPHDHLALHFSDKMMEVTIDFHVSPATLGTRLVHTIEITPKTLVAKLLTPMIRKQVPQQTIGAMEKLKSLLEK